LRFQLRLPRAQYSEHVCELLLLDSGQDLEFGRIKLDLTQVVAHTKPVAAVAALRFDSGAISKKTLSSDSTQQIITLPARP
jgi:hypothetical protein